MYRFIETIRYEDGILHNLEYHNERFNLTRKAYCKCHKYKKIEEIIEIPSGLSAITYKCRLIYGRLIEKTEFIPYKKKEINSLKLICDDGIDYSYKFKNREAIDLLIKQKGDNDDIIIIKNGKLTDASYANLAFFDGREWFTPSTPLLKGTMRSMLIDKGLLKEADISVPDLSSYSRVRLINSMMNLEDGIELDISAIRE